MPQVGRVYRCHACRLELVLDVQRNKLMLAPLLAEKDRRSTDVIKPSPVPPCPR
jgi:hypothetical protein